MILWKKRQRTVSSLSTASSKDFSASLRSKHEVGHENIQDVLYGLLKRPVINLRLTVEKERTQELTSLRTDNWMTALPASTRFLLLASYIASKNPIHTDHTTMGGGSKGRRKRAKITSTNDPDSNGTDVESSLLRRQESITSTHRAIPLDRIFSIYMFIISQSNTSVTDEEYITRPGFVASRFEATSIVRGKRVSNEYGDSQLFSTMSTLVSMR